MSRLMFYAAIGTHAPDGDPVFEGFTAETLGIEAVLALRLYLSFDLKSFKRAASGCYSKIDGSSVWLDWFKDRMFGSELAAYCAHAPGDALLFLLDHGSWHVASKDEISGFSNSFAPSLNGWRADADVLKEILTDQSCFKGDRHAALICRMIEGEQLFCNDPCFSAETRSALFALGTQTDLNPYAANFGPYDLLFVLRSSLYGPAEAAHFDQVKVFPPGPLVFEKASELADRICRGADPEKLFRKAAEQLEKQPDAQLYPDDAGYLVRCVCLELLLKSAETLIKKNDSTYDPLTDAAAVNLFSEPLAGIDALAELKNSPDAGAGIMNCVKKLEKHTRMLYMGEVTKLSCLADQNLKKGSKCHF